MIRLNYGEGSLIGEHNQNVGRPPANPPFAAVWPTKKIVVAHFSGNHSFSRSIFFSLISSIHRRKQLFPVGLLRFQRFSLRIVASALCVHTIIHPTKSWPLYRLAQAG